MVKKQDLRIIKTKKHLYEGLLQQMKDKTFEEVKVSDICEASLVNRSTFYDHFNDKYELLASLIKDLEEELVKKLGENDLHQSKDYYMRMIDLLFDHIDENSSIYSAILKKNKNSIVMDMVYDTLLKDVEEHIARNAQGSLEIPIEIISKFYVSAVINVCLDYIKLPKKYKKEDILRYLNQLLPKQIY